MSSRHFKTLVVYDERMATIKKKVIINTIYGNLDHTAEDFKQLKRRTFVTNVIGIGCGHRLRYFRLVSNIFSVVHKCFKKIIERYKCG